MTNTFFTISLDANDIGDGMDYVDGAFKDNQDEPQIFDDLKEATAAFDAITDEFLVNDGFTRPLEGQVYLTADGGETQITILKRKFSINWDQS